MVGLTEFEVIKVRVHPDGRMDRKNAALYLDKTKQTLANWAVEGIGPQPVYINGTPYYFVGTCDAWIASEIAKRRSSKKRATTQRRATASEEREAVEATP